MKVEVAVLGSPSLINLMVSVDVKQHRNYLTDLSGCESGDKGRRVFRKPGPDRAGG